MVKSAFLRGVVPSCENLTVSLCLTQRREDTKKKVFQIQGQGRNPSSLMKSNFTVACDFLKSVWQIVYLRTALITLLIAPLAALLADDPLTDAEKKRLADVELAAKRTPSMREAAKTFSEARKAYTEDRRKFLLIATGTPGRSIARQLPFTRLP